MITVVNEGVPSPQAAVRYVPPPDDIDVTSAIQRFDSVYFLMFRGWREELRSNRWHFASRWARHLPTILVQPEQAHVPPKTNDVPEGRIPNCRILPVLEVMGTRDWIGNGLVQAGQIMAYMRACGHRRPLLWCYNPMTLVAYATLPAGGRIFHATENYFHFPNEPEWFTERYRTAMQISDLIVAVSDGVAREIKAQLPDASICLVSNGCDFGGYFGARASDSLATLRSVWRAVAIYAGNINARLDYALIRQAAKANQDILFVFYGPVKDLGGEDRELWRRLQTEANFRYLGPVDAEELPSLYAASDVGLMPYKSEHWLVENGFPLKTLEMAATGLPVVSTLLKPVRGLAAAIHVEDRAEDFVAAVGRIGRDRLTFGERAELEAVCRSNDYDRKFEQVIELYRTTVPESSSPLTRLEYIAMTEEFSEWLLQFCRPKNLEIGRPGNGVGTPSLSRLSRAGLRLAEMIPAHWRRRAPQGLRSLFRRLVFGSVRRRAD